MRRPEFTLLLLLISAIGLAGCGHNTRDTKAGKVLRTDQVAKTYDFRDSPETRKRHKLEDKLGLANQQMRFGDYAGAEQLAREALKIDENSLDAYTLLAVIYSHQGQKQEAGEAFRKATELAPTRGDVLNNYGAWLCANGYPAEALVWFDRAVADPKYRPNSAIANAGGCALQAGQMERAGRDLEKAVTVDPTNAYALESMARYKFQLGKYFDARAFSERRLAAAPATASVLQLAIQIEQGLGDKAAASRYQQRLLKEFPEASTANPGANAL